MKHKTTIALFKILFGFFVLVMPMNCVLGQTIDPVTLPGTPPLGICASASSRHSVNFSINETTGAFPLGTTFSVEFSFTFPYSPQYVSINNVLNSTSPTAKSVSFELPNNFVGSDSYKIRVVSSNGITSSWYPTNGSFYYVYFRPYILNSFSIFGGAINANICSGGTITLEVDPTTPTQPSPRDFPGLTYKWEKSTTGTPGSFSPVSPLQIGITCTVSSPGFYRARIDYGKCTEVVANPPTSQTVNVTQSGTGTNFTIASTLTNPVCSGTPTRLSVQSGYSYIWFKDGIPIANALDRYFYDTDQPGSYYVKVSAGTCGQSDTAPYLVEVKPISAKIDKPAAPLINFVLLGESLLVTASTQGTSPTYQWTFGGTDIIGETNTTFSATAPGNYSVKITATNPTATCATTEEIKFILKNGVPAANIPNAISPNNDGVNDTWIIPQQYLTGSKTEIQILSAQGKVEFTTSNYNNDWPTNTIDFKNTNPIYYYIITTANQETKMGSITVIK